MPVRRHLLEHRLRSPENWKVSSSRASTPESTSDRRLARRRHPAPLAGGRSDRSPGRIARPRRRVLGRSRRRDSRIGTTSAPGRIVPARSAVGTEGVGDERRGTAATSREWMAATSSGWVRHQIAGSSPGGPDQRPISRVPIPESRTRGERVISSRIGPRPAPGAEPGRKAVNSVAPEAIGSITCSWSDFDNAC